ncbi:hypothetical protein MSPP1_000426 [Malassezia sp. CBS 17886]|nr:hypothetical protein MSPP1_000426 [Malassezia sp. CBS 17886]
MAATGSTGGRVLRSLDHLWMNTNTKFSRRLRPTYMQSPPAYVAPKDRIRFWNIAPGDVVKLRSGAVGHDEHSKPIRGEGIVTRVDRTTNRVWLRDANDEVRLAPRNIKHAVPRMVDPSAGEEKGYSGNVTEVPRPVHYSKVMLKVPNTQQYASRIVRSKPYWDKAKGMFVWKRFAIVKATSEEAVRAGEALKKVEVPWPKFPTKRRLFKADLADARLVQEETWVPWVPEDPVLLPAPRQRATPAGEADAAERRAQWAARREAKLAEANAPLATPLGAQTYEGFRPKIRICPPPIAQPPTAAETLARERARLADFVQSDAVRAHVEQGGQVFAACDYLDVAPLTGPAAGGDWGALEGTQTRGDRRADGRLAQRPSKQEVDAMPLELLMTNDLANERGLKWRMRRWNAREAARKEGAADAAAESAALLQELDALRM